MDHKRSQLATKGLDHKRSQEHRLGSNDPRVTSSQFSLPRILVERANLCTKAKARTQEVLKSFTPKSHQKQQMLVGEKRGRTTKNTTNGTSRTRSKGFHSLRGEMDRWKCRSRSSPSILQRSTSLGGGIGRSCSFELATMEERQKKRATSR